MSIVRKPGSAAAELNKAEVTALRQIATAVFNGLDKNELSNDMIVCLLLSNLSARSRKRDPCDENRSEGLRYRLQPEDRRASKNLLLEPNRQRY